MKHIVFSKDEELEAFVQSLQHSFRQPISETLFRDMSEWSYQLVEKLSKFQIDLLSKAIVTQIHRGTLGDPLPTVLASQRDLSICILNHLEIGEELTQGYINNAIRTLQDQGIKDALISAISRSRAKSAEEMLGTLLMENRAETVEACVSALSFRGSPGALRWLVLFYHEKDRDSRARDSAYFVIKTICDRLSARLGPTQASLETIQAIQEQVSSRADPISSLVVHALAYLTNRDSNM